MPCLTMRRKLSDFPMEMEGATGDPRSLWRRLRRWRTARAEPVGLVGAYSGFDGAGAVHTIRCRWIDDGSVVHEGPVIYLEHKLLSEVWLGFSGRRQPKKCPF